MKRSSLYCILLAILLTGVYSCKKVNGINNNTVLETPYTIYYADTAGVLYSSNDGIAHKLVFPADGALCRAICVSGNNVIFIKNNLYVSVNNGQNFNHGFDSLWSVHKMTCSGKAFDLNQSMIIDVPDWNKVYTVSGAPHNPVLNQNNYMGIEYTNNHGIRGSYANEAVYDTGGRVGRLPVAMYSYTRLVNGVLCGLAINKNYDPASGDGDTVLPRNFYKTCGSDDCHWMEATGRPVFGVTDTNGVPLPPTAAYPDSGFFTLGHYNNRLIAIDQTCHYGAFFSDDTGRIWKRYSGLPANTSMLCIASPFEQLCFVGTYGSGLYRLNVNTQTFEPCNKGLGTNLVVRSIASKENIYKNGNKKRYIYLATNKGIYQSVDDGANWIRTIEGNFVAIY